MSTSPDCETMNWHAEAQAVINDMSPYVTSITVSDKHHSSDNQIFLSIETIEGARIVVVMDINGFSICDTEDSNEDNCSESERPNFNVMKGPYETINSLLDDNSSEYRKAFAQALMDKIQSIDK